MKAPNSIAVIALTATIMSFAINALSAGPVKNTEGRRANPAVAQASGKSDARKGGEWFADPKRGWVRVDERRDGLEKARPSNGDKAKIKKNK